MSVVASRVLLVAVSAAAFVVAAKAHGMQLRLERQLAGYWEVTFGAPNAPYVEALWWRERVTLWAIGVALGVAAIAYRFLAHRRALPLPLADAPWLSAAWMLLVVPAVAAFVASGAWSAGRFATELSRASPAPAWVAQAVWMAAAWWAGTGLLAAGSAYLALRRAGT